MTVFGATACPFSFFNIDISSFLLSNSIILNEILTTMHNPLLSIHIFDNSSYLSIYIKIIASLIGNL